MLRAKAEQLMRTHLEVMTTLRTVVSDGYPSGGTGAGDENTSVEAAVISRQRWVGVHDEYVTSIERALTLVSRCCNLADKALGAVARPAQQDRYVGLTPCANVHGCPDEAWAEVGRRGRCYACWRFERSKGRDRRERNERNEVA
jgi:hypothetical protein